VCGNRYFGFQGRWESTQPDDEDLTPDEDGNDVVVPVCDKCYNASGFGWGRDNTRIKILGHTFCFDTSFRMND
jgi:hypothetical protein